MPALLAGYSYPEAVRLTTNLLLPLALRDLVLKFSVTASNLYCFCTDRHKYATFH